MVILESGLMVTSETRDLVRRGRQQRTWVHMIVRSVGVERVWDCMLCTCVSEEGGDWEGVVSEASSLLSYTLLFEILGGTSFYWIYYESIKRELKRRLIYEYRCNERLKTKTGEFTRLSDTGLVVELEHLKTKTMLIDKKFASVRGWVWDQVRCDRRPV